MEQNETKKLQKVATKFYCEYCHYNVIRKSSWDKHILTQKHLNLENETKMKQKVATKLQYDKRFDCICGISFKSRTTLWRHKKTCQGEKKSYKQYFDNNEDLVHAILHDNQEFKQMLMEQHNTLVELSSKNTTVINNTTSNVVNNNFNLQMFLNVQCKDALNIDEFIDSLQPKLEDLEATGRLGYVEGISKIFINGLQGLDINTRPLHCSDQKRETIYIKDKNVWEKDSETREKLTLAIKKVASKNIKQIPVWQKANPDCFDPSSKKNDQYLKIVSNSMNGLTAEEAQKNYDKIIRKVAREVVIQKDQV
jgi:hypothetical protein